MKLHIAVLPGDGIGPEVVEQALNVTKAVCEKFGHSLEYQTAPVGACAIEETGLPYPDSTHAEKARTIRKYSSHNHLSRIDS